MNISNKPSHVTAYDLLKSFAVIIMIIDHIGYYFFPTEMWWRAIGRIGFPVWFFLIGYSRSQSIPKSFWIGGTLLLLINLAVGRPLLPLNALFTMVFIRLILTPLMTRMQRLTFIVYPVLIVLCAFAYTPTKFIMEYSTFGLLFAIVGYITRHRERFSNDIFLFTGFLALTLFCLWMDMLYNFTSAQNTFNVIGSGIVIGLLLFYLPRGKEYPSLEKKPVLALPLKWMGRYTLEIYVAHLALFKIIEYFL